MYMNPLSILFWKERRPPDQRMLRLDSKADNCKGLAALECDHNTEVGEHKSEAHQGKHPSCCKSLIGLSVVPFEKMLGGLASSLFRSGENNTVLRTGKGGGSRQVSREILQAEI